MYASVVESVEFESDSEILGSLDRINVCARYFLSEPGNGSSFHGQVIRTLVNLLLRALLTALDESFFSSNLDEISSSNDLHINSDGPSSVASDTWEGMAISNVSATEVSSFLYLCLCLGSSQLRVLANILVN